MKFGKLLKDQISEVPNELKPKFLSYKELKKQLKGISPGTPANTWENESHEGHEGETCCGKSKSAERAEGGREVERERERRGGEEGQGGSNAGGGTGGAGAGVGGGGGGGGDDRRASGEPASASAIARKVENRGAGGGAEEKSNKERNKKGKAEGKEREGNRLTPEEGAFVSKLNLEIIKFNDYFIKREEELIIRVKDLGDRLQASSSESETDKLRSASVHLHGEIVLLLHWCELNYIGLVKILKKHDKMTGLLLRSPYLANVVQQPFCSTTILKRLVKQVESIIFSISPDARQDMLTAEGQQDGSGREGRDEEEEKSAAVLPQLVSSLDPDNEVEEEGGILKQTKVAISLWRELQKSKTPGGQVNPKAAEAVVDSHDEGKEQPSAKKAKTG